MDVGALCGGLCRWAGRAPDRAALCSVACRHGSGRQEREVKGARRRAGDSPVAGVQTTGQGLRMTGNTLLFLALPSRRSLAISRSRPARVNIGVRACPAVGRFSMHGCTSGLLRWWKTPQRYTRSPDDTASLQASHCTSPSGRPRKPRDVQNARSLPCRPPRAVRPAPSAPRRILTRDRGCVQQSTIAAHLLPPPGAVRGRSDMRSPGQWTLRVRATRRCGVQRHDARALSTQVPFSQEPPRPCA